MKSILKYLFITVILKSMICFSQNKIIFNEKSIIINDSIIYDNGILKKGCLKKFDKLFQLNSRSKRNSKGYNNTYFYKFIGIELYYSWKNECNLDRISVNFSIKCPNCNLLYKDVNTFKNYSGDLKLLGVKITKDLTVSQLKKENALSNYFAQTTFLNKNYIEYKNELLKYVIYFSDSTDTARIENISAEIYRLKNSKITNH